MSSFFIRSNKDNADKKGKKGVKRKLKVHTTTAQQLSKKKKKENQLKRKSYLGELIPSEDEEDEGLGGSSKELNDVSDDEAHLTAQEKKLVLAKQYLEEIERDERAKREEEDGDVNDEAILGRLKNDVLEKEGKLRKRVADKLRTEYEKADFSVLKCKEHNLSLTCLAVSPSNFAYTGSKDCSIVKWSLTERRKVGVILPRHKNKSDENLHSTPVLCLAVSHDDKYLASGDEGPLIRLWDTNTLVHQFNFTGHRDSVTGLAFCRQGLTLYSCSKDKTIKVWNVVERAYVETLFGHQTAATGLDLMGKDRVVTSGGADNSIRLWKIQDESQLVFTLDRSIDSVRRLSDINFVSCGDDGSVCFWAISKKKPMCRIQNAHGTDESSGEPNWVTSVACVFNTEVFASGSSDGCVRLWKVEEGYKKVTALAKIPIRGFANAMAFTANGQYLAVAVGQEHRLGRWTRIKEARNSLVIVKVIKS